MYTKGRDLVLRFDDCKVTLPESIFKTTDVHFSMFYNNKKLHFPQPLWNGWLCDECCEKCTCIMGKEECLHTVPRADFVHVLLMPRANLQPRADTLDVRCWFWHQIRTRHP